MGSCFCNPLIVSDVFMLQLIESTISKNNAIGSKSAKLKLGLFLKKYGSETATKPIVAILLKMYFRGMQSKISRIEKTNTV